MTSAGSTPSMYAVCAAVVLPVPDEAIEDGAVLVRHGAIAAVGRRRDILSSQLPRLTLRNAVMTAGLVNAHTHLSLSTLGAARPTAPGFATWIAGMARSAAVLTPSRLARGLRWGRRESIRAGTTAVGDIVPLAARSIAEGSLGGVRFLELLGFDRPFDPALVGRLEAAEGLAPHAPYSTSEDIYRGAAAFARDGGARLALHVAESPEEDQFIRGGRGPLHALLESIGRMSPGWSPPGVSPVRHLDRLGALGPTTLAIHATFATPTDLELLAKRGATVVTCPRSNLALTGQTVDVPALLERGHRVAVGTDSLASSPSLSLLDELRALRAAHPSLTASTALAMATTHGARALGIDAGQLVTGSRADLAAFTLGRADVNPAEQVLRAREAAWVAIGGTVVRGRRPR